MGCTRVLRQECKEGIRQQLKNQGSAAAVGCKNVQASRTKEHHFKKKGGTGTEPEIAGVSRGRTLGKTGGGRHCAEELK